MTTSYVLHTGCQKTEYRRLIQRMAEGDRQVFARNVSKFERLLIIVRESSEWNGGVAEAKTLEAYRPCGKFPACQGVG